MAPQKKIKKQKNKNKNKKTIFFGVKRESNPRPLAPKARIMPLDHWPIWVMFLYCFKNKLIIWRNKQIITIKNIKKEKTINVYLRPPRIELGIFCVLSRRHNQLDQGRIWDIILFVWFVFILFNYCFRAQKVESNHWACFISYRFEVCTPHQWRSSTHIRNLIN